MPENGRKNRTQEAIFVHRIDYELDAKIVGKPVYLPSEAMEHVIARHVLGEGLDRKTKTTFYPVGQKVKGREIPGVMKVEEIVYYIDEAVKEGKPRLEEDKIVIIYEFDEPEKTGINRLKVVLKEVKGDFGIHFEVLTAYPISGPYVPLYEDGRWVR
ncbi:MAG: hypothetical protein J7L37_04830 [Thermococcus sp.]|nr:hypothetical protein [Thermococcus sp.]